MAAKKRNYTATAPFDYGDESFKVGDTFKIPEDWEVDEEFTQLRTMSQPDNKQIAFQHQVQVGVEANWKGLTKVKTPVYDMRRVILPVE